MRQVIKVALPGYNAETDTDPDHFALYVDPDERVDYVLIKEKEKANIAVAGNNNEVITHGLGYVPFALVFVEYTPGAWRKLFSHPLDSSGYWFEIDSTNLTIYNTTSTQRQFAYRIFYDQIA